MKAHVAWALLARRESIAANAAYYGALKAKWGAEAFYARFKPEAVAGEFAARFAWMRRAAEQSI